MSLERPLRLLTYLATAVAVPLNIVATVLSIANQNRGWDSRNATAFCFAFIPLALTVAASTMSLQYMKKHGKSPRGSILMLLDVASVSAYIGVLVPCWSIEILEFSTGGFGLLVGFTTAPMIINMLVHAYFIQNQVPYKSLLSKLYKKGSTCQQCPNCQAKFISGTTETTTKKGYSLLRGEDYLDVEADHVQYRDSEDFLGEGADRAEQGDQAEQDERSTQPNSDTSKDMVEV
ncbi:uncharacterized protein EKO05_0006980 [Ascochyta rabiei]|uniref:Uncharacterized protein n=1 Tax=Didymella rabiei TaxID=5454 RepID=A0A162YZ69_DIDRA|nr:uncharacterized protein EKO05_0006980 [Ascochyta rabiei]KZM20311.1 hypothetical protein ST47_g8456 [Ascochyta rabiei]UPX16589.1 hypothetical protein EKO05_0006980 [Ascochyta rabiei]